MAAILVVVLCIAVVISAVAAERSARARHRFRAVCLNLFGIGCLGVGLLSLYAWCHGGVVVVRQVAMAETETNPGTLVRLVARQRPVCRAQTLPEKPAEPAEPAAEPRHPQADCRREVEDPAGRAAGGGHRISRLLGSTMARTMRCLTTCGLRCRSTSLPDRVGRSRASGCGSGAPGVRDRGPLSAGSAGAQRVERGAEAGDGRVHQRACWTARRRRTGSRFDESRIRQTLVSPGNFYDEKVISPSVGVMHQSHALLEFGPEFHRDDRADMAADRGAGSTG